MNKHFIDATPKTYFIHSLRNAHLPQGVRTALGEFIDNSLGEGSGDATKVTIVYDSDNIAIIDNGKGMTDLGQMLTLGDSQNRLSDTDIGNFGFGSKVGALYLGWVVEIFTVNEDGEYRRARVDWAEMIIIRDRHEDRTWQWSSLAADLAHTYRPALEDGREIELVHKSGGKQHLFLSKYLEADVVNEAFTLQGSVNGKGFTVQAGERTDGASGKSGAHIAYGHRVIETTKSLPDTPLPAAFYAMIKLDPSWKRSLGSNKTTIAIDRLALLEEVLRLTKHIIDGINSKNQEVRLDLINAQISEEMNKALKDGGGKDLAALRYWEPASWTRHSTEKDDDGEDKKKHSGLTILLEDLNGHAVWECVTAGSKVTIQLNKQVEYIEQAYESPLDPSAVWSMVACAIADSAEENADSVKLLKLSPDDVDFINNQTGRQRRQIILHRILSRAPTIKEPTQKQIEEAKKEKENNG